MKSRFKSLLPIALVSLAVLMLASSAGNAFLQGQAFNAQGALITQQFGDGTTVTFTPGTVATGKVLLAQVNGVPTDFIWASSTTITFGTAPADKSIIDFRSADKKGANLRTTATIDFASSATLVSDTSSAIALPGAAVGDACLVGTVLTPSGAAFHCFVDTANNVKVVYQNVTTGTVNPASAVFTINVFTHN